MSIDLKREAIEKHHQDFDCSHDFVNIRKRQIKGGSFQWINQCLRCGESVGNPISKIKAEANGIVKDWDYALEEDWNERRLKSYRQAEKAGDEEFWRQYNNYLGSAKWQEKRKKVLKRDNYVCQGCLTNRATQVHHLTYKHVGKELLFELISICDECHEVAHEDKHK